jgi:hypothetical protein
MRWLVQRGIEIISEASRGIPDAAKSLRSEVPWKKIAGIGNVLRHDYSGIADVSSGASSTMSFPSSRWRSKQSPRLSKNEVMPQDYYEPVVVNYLRADRAIFVNTECCVQLNQADNPDTSGDHWYCDAVALDLRAKAVFLCEISYAKGFLASSGVSRNGTITGACSATRLTAIALFLPIGPALFVHGCSCRKSWSRRSLSI